MGETGRQRRNARIEALRLIAIACIAVFHTFQPLFDALTAGSWEAGAPMRLALGCVSLLGAYGNHVFFLISGFFLVPRAAQAAREKGFLATQLRASGRRAATILASVALWAAVALVVSAWVVPLEGVSLGSAGWLVGGLQFIWVYLAVVVAVPLIGWAWARVRSPRAVVCALVCATLAVNAYIAFVSPGGAERGLLEWRKLMSAASYLVAFLTGGALAGADLSWGRRALAASVAASVAAEAWAALSNDLVLLGALSFKSTSALSFALAVSSLACVAARGEDPGAEGPLAAAARALAPSILGFYIVQSMFYSLWRPAADALLAAVAAAGPLALLATGTLFSLAFLAAVLLVDRLFRVRLARLA